MYLDLTGGSSFGNLTVDDVTSSEFSTTFAMLAALPRPY